MDYSTVEKTPEQFPLSLRVASATGLKEFLKKIMVDVADFN